MILGSSSKGSGQNFDKKEEQTLYNVQEGLFRGKEWNTLVPDYELRFFEDLQGINGSLLLWRVIQS